MGQLILRGVGCSSSLPALLKTQGMNRPLLICGASYARLPVRGHLAAAGLFPVIFSGFSPNPTVDEAMRAVSAYRENGCDSLLAVGGGSAMDIAKCVKAFLDEGGEPALDQPVSPAPCPLAAVPTTAGTGSESTHFAVLYQNGVKHSIAHLALLPSAALLDSTLLSTLPGYQKRCTYADAVCQSVEAWWSVLSTDQSIALSRAALSTLLTRGEAYFSGDAAAAQDILEAANLAGQAINIARTTAAHAMSYRLSSLYHLPHGHAAALCLPYVAEYIAEHVEQTRDPRGSKHLKHVLGGLCDVLGGDCAERLHALFFSLGLTPPTLKSEDELALLARSVNYERLLNTPVALTPKALDALYRQIFSKENADERRVF